MGVRKAAETLAHLGLKTKPLVNGYIHSTTLSYTDVEILVFTALGINREE